MDASVSPAPSGKFDFKIITSAVITVFPFRYKVSNMSDLEHDFKLKSDGTARFSMYDLSLVVNGNIAPYLDF